MKKIKKFVPHYIVISPENARGFLSEPLQLSRRELLLLFFLDNCIPFSHNKKVKSDLYPFYSLTSQILNKPLKSRKNKGLYSQFLGS
jgi:hypothetical protein